MGQPSDPYREMSEVELQVAYAAGDPKATEELWRRHEAALVQQAKRQAGEADIAHDALQDIRTKLDEPGMCSKYDPAKPWKNWVSSVLKNEITNKHRKQSRLRQHEQREPTYGMAAFPDDTDSYEHRRMQTEPLEQFRRARPECLDNLKKLGKLLYQVFELRFLRDPPVKVEDGAKLLGIDKSQVSRKAREACLWLSQCLREKGVDP